MALDESCSKLMQSAYVATGLSPPDPGGFCKALLFVWFKKSCYRSVGRVVLIPSPATGKSRITLVMSMAKRDRGCDKGGEHLSNWMGELGEEACTLAGASQRYSADCRIGP